MILSYNANKMEELLLSFYKLTKIRIVVFSDTFSKIAEAPGYDCSFCQLIRSDSTAEKKCHESDRYACEQSHKRNGLYSYTCHAGLTETVAPIRYESLVIGYLMLGQVLQHSDSDAHWHTITELCSNISVDMNKLAIAYKKMRPVDIEQMYAATKILEACAGYLWLERTISLLKDSLPEQIDNFIMQNLNADLSVTAICIKFGISRSKLYKIAQEYYGCGVEQMTRTMRVRKAKELLETTDEPVSEISYKVGYPDYNYFIKVFKKETGLTPRKYRNRTSY